MPLVSVVNRYHIFQNAVVANVLADHRHLVSRKSDAFSGELRAFNKAGIHFLFRGFQVPHGDTSLELSNSEQVSGVIGPAGMLNAAHAFIDLAVPVRVEDVAHVDQASLVNGNEDEPAIWRPFNLTDDVNKSKSLDGSESLGVEDLRSVSIR